MGCDSSKQKAVSLKSETAICMWFKYKFTEKADRDHVYAVFAKVGAYLKSKGAFGTWLANYEWMYTADGWEAWETFPNGEAYEVHAKNMMAYAGMADIFAIQDQFTETASLIQGPEAEIAKAPSIKEFYPNHKIVFGKCEPKITPPIYDYKNKRDANEEGKKGGPIVCEFHG
jgi:hypothetical protein